MAPGWKDDVKDVRNVPAAAYAWNAGGQTRSAWDGRQLSLTTQTTSKPRRSLSAFGPEHSREKRRFPVGIAEPAASARAGRSPRIVRRFAPARFMRSPVSA